MTLLYYIGLVMLPVFVLSLGFLDAKWEDRVGIFLVMLVVLYLGFGFNLLGWKLGLVNLGVIFISGNLELPLLRMLAKRISPTASYRFAMGETWREWFGRLGVKMGVGKRKA